MICIYTPQNTPRIQYIAKVICQEVLGVTYTLTHSQQTFLVYNGAKIAYNAQLALSEKYLLVKPHGLLSEESIHSFSPESVLFENVPVLFPTQGGDLPFDVFSAVFYLVSRYEEYLPHTQDKHGRFVAEASVAFKNGFLKKPLANYYIQFLATALKEKFPNLIFPEKKTKTIPTIDVDNAFAYLHKGMFFHIGSLAKKALKLQWQAFSLHLKSIINAKNDPYNTYQFLQTVHDKFGLQAVFFFLVGKKGKYDRNLSLHNTALQHLLRAVAEKNSVGIHPSYASDSDYQQILSEKQSLEALINKPIAISRQHYLKMTLPKTYLALEKAGITEDYTMGYASQLGFRASICMPYTFYFLGEERISNLTIHPFCAMDATLHYYLNVKAENVMKEVKPLFDEVKKFNGEINLLFHNESVGGKLNWNAWDKVYASLIEEAVK